MVAVPECQAVYENQMSFKNQFPGGFGDNKLCAGGTVEGGKDACQVSQITTGRSGRGSAEAWPEGLSSAMGAI